MITWSRLSDSFFQRWVSRHSGVWIALEASEKIRNICGVLNEFILHSSSLIPNRIRIAIAQQISIKQTVTGNKAAPTMNTMVAVSILCYSETSLDQDNMIRQNKNFVLVLKAKLSKKNWNSLHTNSLDTD